MGFEILTSSQLKALLSSTAERVNRLQQQRIQNQTNVDGSPFPKLKIGTINSKKRAGGGISGNAEKRMIATGDFRRHAFEYKVSGNGVTFFISPKVHKLTKIAQKRKGYETKKAKGKNMKSPKASYTGKNGMLTYSDIAMYQLNGKYSTGWRSSSNAGAAFFGVNGKEANNTFNFMQKEAVGIARQNIEKELSKMIMNARNK